MGSPFLSEIRIFSFNFPPKGWAFCNGQLLPISQNNALFSLLGTTYGGNGTTHFALPDLQGRVPLHAGVGFTLGQSGGEEVHTLTFAETAHAHSLLVQPTLAHSNSPGGNVLAATEVESYAAPAAGQQIPMLADTLSAAGGGQPHPNLQPFLTLNFCIALQGIFPSQS